MAVSLSSAITAIANKATGRTVSMPLIQWSFIRKGKCTPSMRARIYTFVVDDTRVQVKRRVIAASYCCCGQCKGVPKVQGGTCTCDYPSQLVSPKAIELIRYLAVDSNS